MVCYKRGWRSTPYYKLIFRRGTQFSRELSCLAAWNYLGRIKMDLGLLVYASESCVSCQNGYTRPEWAYHGSNTSLRDYPASSLMCHCERRWVVYQRVSCKLKSILWLEALWTSSFTDVFVCLCTQESSGRPSSFSGYRSRSLVSVWTFGCPIMRSCRLMNKCFWLLCSGEPVEHLHYCMPVCCCELNTLLLLLLLSLLWLLSCLFFLFV